jgi:hypothetical protein
MRPHHIKTEAERTSELEWHVLRAQDRGWSLLGIVDTIEAGRDGTVGLVGGARQRQAAADGPKAGATTTRRLPALSILGDHATFFDRTEIVRTRRARSAFRPF